MDENEITASNDTLLKQAPMTANEYMRKAIDAIDKEFGAGYAKGNPELVAAFMRTAAMDFHTSVYCRTLQNQLSQIERTLSSIASSMKNRPENPI